MLQQVICVVCEKVIVGVSGDFSLINIFNKMMAGVPPEVEIPPNAVAPKEWAVFAAYDPEPDDELKEYVFCMQMFYPDQTQFGVLTKQKLKIEPDKRCQVTANINGFPIGQHGTYAVRVWIEENEICVLGPTDLRVLMEMNRNAPQPTTTILSTPNPQTS